MSNIKSISKEVIDSDIFCDLPLSAQALYFHYLISSDANGKLNNPRSICKAIGANLYDMHILLSYGLIKEMQTDEYGFRGVEIVGYESHLGGGT